MIDERLIEWATPRQVEYLKALDTEGTYRKASTRLGVHHDTVRQSLKNLRKLATSHGYSPEHGLTHPIPAPFIAKGYSTLRKLGVAEPLLQWEKTKLDDQLYHQMIREAIKVYISDCPKILAPTKPTNVNTDIIPWIQIGDAHLGMLAHEAETGENFDIKIAEREICAAILMLLNELPKAERVVINDLGDFTHYENFGATTEASGHALDFDSRFPVMIRAYARIMRFIIDAALQRFRCVDVIVNQGNHSRTNDIWMAELLRSTYDHTGRVNVLNNDTAFIGYRMGNTFVMTHHSDKCKPAQLGHVMATDFPTDWGETEYRYIDIGHIHHSMVLKEHPGVTVESFNPPSRG